jgi:murein DD-endopeptidase MepM/ murein hydrolase activator NlpD
MKRALRYPSRWAGRSRTLLTAAALSVALGACSYVGLESREGTMEYPGSGAAPGSVPIYTVRYRDTVDSIAQRYGVSTQSIIDRNKLQPPYPLQPGQSIEVPGARVVEPDAALLEQTAAASTPSKAPVKQQALPPPDSGQTTTKPNPALPGEPTPLSPAAASEPPAGPAPRFEWPLHGKILAGYGPGANGQKNDGIDIAASKGAPIKAADGGTVVYAGSDVTQLGNLLLVQHSAGYITAYGNCDVLMVKKGDTVKKGQVIAKAGDSGSAPTPRLHFEIRRGGSKTIDPVSMLPMQ